MTTPTEPVTTPADLDTYLGLNGTVDEARAKMLLKQAQTLAEAVVDPLPSGSDAIVLAAAARCYTNPAGVSSESVGPYSASRPWPGVWLTRSERRALRSLAGQFTGAFTIDPTPADAMVGYRDPLEPYTLEEAEQAAENIYPSGE